MHIKQETIQHNFNGFWKYVHQFSFLKDLHNLASNENKTGHQVIKTFFIGHILRYPNTNAIFESQKMKKVTKKIFHKSFDVDTARYHLSKVEKEHNNQDLRDIMNHFVSNLSKKKILQKTNTYTCQNGVKLIPIGVDGSESFRTYNKQKIEKLENKACTGHTKSEDTDNLYAKHFCSYLVTLIGKTKLILGFEVAGKQESDQSKNDCEKNLFIKLISNLRKATKINNFIIVGDSMYLDKNRMLECINNHMHFLFTLKDNCPSLISEFWCKANLFHIKFKEYTIKVGRTNHHIAARRIICTETLSNHLLYVCQFIDLETNESEFVVSDLDLPISDVYYLKHKRWEEENAFNYLTKYYNINHNFILDAKNLTTLLQVMAYNFTILYLTYYLKTLIIINGQPSLIETIDVIKDSLFRMKKYKLLNLDSS